MIVSRAARIDAENHLLTSDIDEVIFGLDRYDDGGFLQYTPPEIEFDGDRQAKLPLHGRRQNNVHQSLRHRIFVQYRRTPLVLKDSNTLRYDVGLGRSARNVKGE